MTALPRTLEPLLNNVANLHETIASAHPKLSRGLVWCTRCDRSQTVDTAQCLRTGWPMCCGATMTIDSPDERKAAEQARASAPSAMERQPRETDNV